MNAEQIVRLVLCSLDFADFQEKIFLGADLMRIATERERRLAAEIERLQNELERLKRTSGES